MSGTGKNPCGTYILAGVGRHTTNSKMIRIQSVSGDVSAVENMKTEEIWGGGSNLKSGDGEGLPGRGHSNPKGEGGRTRREGKLMVSC